MGFRKQIFVNGHGQEEVLPLAIHQWAEEVPGAGDPDHPAHLEHDSRSHEGQGPRRSLRHALLPRRRGGVPPTRWPCSRNSCDMKLAVDNKPEGFLPPGHVDKGGEVYHAPIKGHEHIGLGGIELQGLPRRGHRPSHQGLGRQGQGRRGGHDGLHVQADRRHHDQVPGRRPAPGGQGHRCAARRRSTPS
ncbi:MAG: hypothetical protein MZV70_65270 [Desulfobacterales bacterium]|nr:hypothetical protein [Desulfobacterales bacterium]